MRNVAAALVTGLVLFPFGYAIAEPQQSDQSSKVDPSTTNASTPKARPSSPGTVGAMGQAGGGSFTASEADRKKNLTKAMNLGLFPR